MRNPFKKNKQQPNPVRPRFGKVINHHGELRLVVFHPVDESPNLFIARYADTEKPVVARIGDRLP